jgi:DtxR family Mn-dependent transcriptional regulator
MAVLHSSDDLLKYLNSRELALGSKIKVRSVEPFDDSMTVSYGGHKAEMLSNKVCEKLLVKES